MYRKQQLGRRTRDGSWQWMAIGILLGMGCSLVMLLSANLFGYVEIGSQSSPTEAGVVVATTTPNPATLPPTQDTASQPTVDENAPTSAVQPPPSFTPALDSQATATPTLLPGGSDSGFKGGEGAGTTGGDDPNNIVGTPPVGTQVINALPTSSVPDSLRNIATSLVQIPGGTFAMGTTIEEGQAAVAECVSLGALCTEAMIADSLPPHQITLDPYQMEVYEVTVAQYAAFLNHLLETGDSSSPHLSACGGPCALTTNDSGYTDSDITFDGTSYAARGVGTPIDRSQYPATLVTWYGAQRYCEAIGRSLPTEAQWERAARGPSNWIYPWGQQWISTNANTKYSGQDSYVPVNEYATAQSAEGLYNMAGNVSEWVSDWYGGNYYTNSEPVNPRGPTSGEVKVVRGGSWDNPPMFARTVHRVDTWEPTDASFSVGFRCAAR